MPRLSGYGVNLTEKSGANCAPWVTHSVYLNPQQLHIYLLPSRQLTPDRPHRSDFPPSPAHNYVRRAFLRLSQGALMTVCPVCHSTHVASRHVARQTASAIGGVAGAATGAASTLSGAKVGAAFGAVAGPVGIAVGGLAGALLGGLIGATAGTVAGGQLGDVVDEHYLGNCQCLDCGNVFSSNSRS